MHVCQTLSEPNEQGLQTCQEWIVVQDFGRYPQYTPQELQMLGNYIIYAVVVVWCFKTLGDLIKKFT